MAHPATVIRASFYTDRLRGGERIAGYYRGLLGALRIDRFEPVRRWYGDRHVVDESILHGTAVGRVFGLEGRGRPVRVRLLHVFDFADGLISRESAWLDGRRPAAPAGRR
jgi:uncharacterized protein